MVTREEKHTTRGRTHLLWEMLQGSPIEGGWRNEDVKGALDLCLACKGCKGDCPVNVDVATYKAEFLSHYWEGRLRPRQAYAFGWIDKWARAASLAPGLANAITQTPGVRALAKWAADVPFERDIPPFAPQTFRRWFEKRGRRHAGAPQVMLWPDTFNNHFLPETAQAAVEVLEATGHEVVLPRRHLCCGRPLYDYGFLDMAERYLHRVLRDLAPAIDLGTPLVVLEPSCASVFRDELKNLLPDREDAQRLASQTLLLSEFLHKTGYEPPRLHRRAIVQGHCHHKAVLRFDAAQAVLDGMGLDWKLLDSGCCGMAGSFGYEQDKYEVSVKAGERVLLPAVRSAAPSTLVLADGFSCKEQIAQGTQREALHLAQAIQLAMVEGREGPVGVQPPEVGIVRRRRHAIRRSILREVLGAGLLIAGAVVAWRRMRRS